MTTGQPPYSGANFMEILTKKATQDPPPPITVREELAPQVSDLIMAAMARNPDSRPQTMETLEYELNKCLAGRGVAVAQILGMTTDPNVVATLNPGLSMRNTDEGIVSSRLATSSPGVSLPRLSTHSGMSELGGMWSGPAMATGAGQRIARAASEPTSVNEPVTNGSGQQRALTPVPVRAASMNEASPSQHPSGSMSLAPKRSALGMFGWLLLGAILFGGVGALVYVALGERGQRQSTKAGDLGSGSDQQPQQPDDGTGSNAVAPTATTTPARAAPRSRRPITPGPGRHWAATPAAPPRPARTRRPRRATPRIPKRAPPTRRRRRRRRARSRSSSPPRMRRIRRP
ncbi:MAG: hypothetical protein IPQ07_19955 [Myxococcales bacterium]|nr:hypothetical protein [Myxococcales bacterium]